MKKLLLCLILPLMLLCLILPVSAAENVLSYAMGGYDDIRADEFAPVSTGTRLFEVVSGDMTVEGDGYRERLRELDGRRCMMCWLPSEEIAEEEGGYQGYTAFMLDVNEYARGYQTLYFGILAEDADGRISVNVEITSAFKELTAKVWIQGGEWNLVAVDIRGLENRIENLRIAVDYQENIPRTIKATVPYLSQTTPSRMFSCEKRASNQWTAVAGMAQIRNGWITPDENLRAEIHAPLITTLRIQGDTTVYFEIRLSGVISGNMMLGVLYAGAGEEQREYQRKLSLNASDGVYTVPVKADAEIVSYSLQFDNLTCEEDGMTVEAISVYGKDASAIGVNTDLGHVESVKRQGSSVVFSGIVERSAAAEYRNSKIHFYAIPGWCDDDLSRVIDLGSIEMTTRFRFTADLAGMGAAAAADTFRFFAGLSTSDGILALSSPRYAEAGNLSGSRVSSMGIYGAEPVEIFESNASNVMVDVKLDELVLESGGTQFHYTYLDSSGDSGQFSQKLKRTLCLNEALLRELDSEIDFYLSAGIQVYLRLTAASPVPGLTYTGEESRNYAVSAADSEMRQRYAFLIRTLCQRWEGISGISLGRAVNYSDLVGDHALEDPAAYAAELAEVCRITYNAASSQGPEIMVIVPYVEYMTDGSDRSSWIADRTIAVMLADKLDEIGSIPWVLMYCVNSHEDDLSSPVTLSRMLTDLELESPAALMLFWQPDDVVVAKSYVDYCMELGAVTMNKSRYVAMRFAELCKNSEDFRARAVFLSVADLPKGLDYTFYGHLKNENTGDSVRYVYEKKAEDTRQLTDHDAVLNLWDFSESHHTMGWLAGGGVTSCITDYSELFAADEKEQKYVRVLRARVDGRSGITLCRFDKTRDFTGIDGMDFTVAVDGNGDLGWNGDEEPTATLVFVVGSEDTRAEYTAENIPYSQIRSFHCDFQGYEHLDDIDYVGVMVYAEGEVYLDIANVLVHSDALDYDGIASVFGAAEPAAEDNTNARRLAVIFCAMTAAASAAAVMVITRHENESEEESVPADED